MPTLNKYGGKYNQFDVVGVFHRYFCNNLFSSLKMHPIMTRLTIVFFSSGRIVQYVLSFCTSKYRYIQLRVHIQFHIHLHLKEKYSVLAHIRLSQKSFKKQRKQLSPSIKCAATFWWQVVQYLNENEFAQIPNNLCQANANDSRTPDLDQQSPRAISVTFCKTLINAYAVGGFSVSEISRQGMHIVHPERSR